MAGDGNCLFRALADQVDGSAETHMRHRQSVCDYMDRNPEEFIPFMDESSPFGRYVSNMRNPGVYGGNIELVAFARNYNVDIKVYQMGGTVFVISGAPVNDNNKAGRGNPVARNLHTVHIAYHSYEHYSSVRNRDGPHVGLPNVKASTKLSFTPVLDNVVEGRAVGSGTGFAGHPGADDRLWGFNRTSRSRSTSSSSSSSKLLMKYGLRLLGLFTKNKP
ncbi:2-oxoglutarate dehydrogenase E1 component [Coemansia sp. RSA 1200]|nr:2-oxoglutarate dehydrogenase E1 component [Coemansia sp. RSA 1200]